MKYLHINPPWYVFHKNLRQPNIPLGSAYLARWAKKAGWEPFIWNADLLPVGGENDYSEEMNSYDGYLVSHSKKTNPIWDELRGILRDIQPDVVGITVLTPSYPSALMTAAIVYEELPECSVIVGGPHVSAGEVFDINVDFEIQGEGEVELFYYLRHGTTLGKSFYNLDEYGYPLRDVCIDKYNILQPDNYGLVMFSRGCAFDCSFCASQNVWGRKVRYRSAKDMAAEMADIHEGFDTRYFSFQDDTFTTSRERIMELMQEIMNTGLISVPGFRWTCNTRPELLDPELIAIMKGAGCAAIAIGIEFGSERMLEKTNKGFTIKDVRNAAKMIKQSGVMLSGQFMFGYPTETVEEMMQTVALADELECESVMVSVATPLPNTPLYREAQELGLIKDIDWATVTTKNDGMLMTVDNPEQVVKQIKAEFDRIQAKTLNAKNRSRLEYEAQYMRDAKPRYGVSK